MNTNNDLPQTFPEPSPDLAAPPTERRDAAEHRQRILSVARTLFAQHGVDAVSMHQIAHAAHVGQGTLYRRYAHKGLLCMALLNEGMISFQKKVLSYLEENSGFISSIEQLYYILVQLMKFNEENAPLLSAITDAACGDHRSHPYRNPFYLWLRQVVMVLLQRAINNQETRSLDIEYVADVLLNPLSIDFYLYQRHELGFSQERLATGLYHFVVQGLAANR